MTGDRKTGQQGPFAHRENLTVFTHAVRRPLAAAAAGSARWMVLTVAGLLAWALLATGAAGTHSHRPADAPVTPLRLTSGDSADTRFHVSSFNILGWTHTRGSSRYADGVKRMTWAHEILRSHHVNVVGFQELQPQQLEKFNELTGKRWSVYPGDRFERIAMHNSIAWKTRRWERVDVDYINIPYFFGDPVKMPVVKLRHRATDRLVYFANFHNPADSYGNAQKWRDQARRKQIDLADRIAETGVPLVITGDMNERDKYFCNMVGKTSMHAANGGSNREGEPCETPDYMGIDWIFGSRAISFTGYKRVETELVRKTTDHPFLVARATISNP